MFSSGMQLYKVAARGGQPELLFDSSDDPRPYSVYPHFLPTGRGPSALVYTPGTVASDHWLAVLNLETGERQELGPGSRAVYSQDGYLIHGPTDSTEPGLWAWPFSLETLEPAGDSFPISTAGLAATLSRDGTLAYRDQAGSASTRTLAWRDRTGELLETVGQPQNMAQPSLSPDGQRVAVRSNESGDNDIWVHDLTRSTKTRLTFEDVTESDPAWSPSGREIAYRRNDPGPGGTLMRKSADGTGEAVVLVESESNLRWPDWSHDGRYLVYTESNSETQRDIRYVELGSDGDASEPVTFLSTPANEGRPQLSPDGQFLAYVSGESGRPEIYVQPFPNGAGKWQVSGNGGDPPRCRAHAALPGVAPNDARDTSYPLLHYIQAPFTGLTVRPVVLRLVQSSGTNPSSNERFSPTCYPCAWVVLLPMSLGRTPSEPRTRERGQMPTL